MDIIVIRISTCNKMGNSRPCYNCLNMMKAIGIRKVHYNDNNGIIISETVKNMVSIQSSSVTRFMGQFSNDTKTTNILYFEKLLKELLPSSIRLINFENFVKHNMLNVLPKYTYTFENLKGKTIVTIFNSDSVKVISTNIVN